MQRHRKLTPQLKTTPKLGLGSRLRSASSGALGSPSHNSPSPSEATPKVGRGSAEPAPSAPRNSIVSVRRSDPQRHARYLFFLLPSYFFLVFLLAHPDKIEDRLLTHFATGVHPIEQNQWPDLTHKVAAGVQGSPLLTNIGPAQALKFNGFTDWLLVASNIAAAKPILPTNEFSVTAWVNLNETTADGGIIGIVQDNGDYEKGWVLGYNRRAFTFLLATRGADDGNGRLTRIAAQTPIQLERWHYVAATYDGQTMRLYVNGKPEAESSVQSRDILYPNQARYAIGAFVDDNEFYPMEGALFETRVYARVLAESEIAEVAAKNQKLIDYKPSVNQELQFVVKPYLQFATPTSIVVMAETTQPAKMLVEYGERQPLTLRSQNSIATPIQELRLTQLKPFTTYFYRVTSTDNSNHIARSEVYSFQTAPDAAQAWAFGILGDTQRNPEVTRKCADGLFALRPNFLLHCGDVVDDGFAKSQWVFDLFEPCARLLAQVPMFPVLGNHEKNAHWYYDYFSLPAPEFHYTFTYGNAQFFMIDSNKDCGPGSDQYRWLERELPKSKATWKFTCHHHPCFSSDEDDYGDHIRGKPGAAYTWGDSNVRRLVPLYEKYGVDIAFAGHIHSYERTWPLFQMAVNPNKGVRYIVSGGGGGGLEQAAPQRSWFSIHLQRGHHYCVAAVHDRTIQFKAYDIEGRLFDTFELTKPPGR